MFFFVSFVCFFLNSLFHLRCGGQGDKLLHWCLNKETGIKCGAINTKNLDLTDERLKTLYRSLYLYIILNWTVVIPLRLYIKPSLEDVLQVEKEAVSFEDTGLFFFFLYKAGLAVIPTCAKKHNSI